jgi:hypothetical protein
MISRKEGHSTGIPYRSQVQDLPNPLQIVFTHGEPKPTVLKLYHATDTVHEK